MGMVSKVVLPLAVVAALLLSRPVQGSKLGTVLDEALKSRDRCASEQVRRNFLIALECATNPVQKGRILALLGEYLLDRGQWEPAIEVFDRILDEGAAADKAPALYAKAQAYLTLNQFEKAREACREIRSSHPDNTVEAFAVFCKGVAPQSLDGRLAEIFAGLPRSETASGSESLAVPTGAAPETDGPAPAPFRKSLSVEVVGQAGDLSGNIVARGMDLDLDDDTDIGTRNHANILLRWDVSEKDQVIFETQHREHRGTLRVPVTYDGLAYARGANLRVRNDLYNLGFRHLLTGQDRSRWAFLAGLQQARWSLTLSQTTGNGFRAGDLDTTVTFPYLGLEGETPLLEKVTLESSFRLFAMKRDGLGSRFSDLSVGLRFGRDCPDARPARLLGIVGYRLALTHADVDDDTVETGYAGPFLALRSRF